MQNLNIDVNDKVRTDLDLHKESNLGMGCMLLKGIILGRCRPNMKAVP